ncbi:MAG TPA: peptide deformylase [Gemmatimonadaceae bacterium]|nr:peptide deformylase [Gemmatimonadaceae bacterium]
MSLLDIRVLGDPVLRQETNVVTEVTAELRRLVDDMFETMYEAKGIGLAAPQVGRLERLSVVDVDGARFVLFNPEIVEIDSKRIKGEEGCLSIPEIYGDVERSARVVVRAMDVEGKTYEVEGRELLSRCLQHEIDHLHGRLFIDYLSALKRRAATSKWAKEKEKYPGNIRRLTPGEIAEHHHRDEEL